MPRLITRESRTERVKFSRARAPACAAFLGLLMGLGVAACRAPGEPVDAWPPEPPENGSVLDRTTYVPGQPEQRAPTAPGGPDPTPRPAPPGPQEREPSLRTPSPHPPGVPEHNQDGAGAGGADAGPSPVERQAEDTEQREAAEPTPGMRELFPNVRADLVARVIEFEGIVPIDAHDPETPRVYLEVTVCTPDTKEHETLVMTEAKPSHVHAALLAIGLTPGNPGGFKWENSTMTTIAPAGDPVLVTFIYRDEDGAEREVPATKWVINAETREPFAPDVAAGSKAAAVNGAGEEGAGSDTNSERGGAVDGRAVNDEQPDKTVEPAGGFVFAGSVMRERMGREMYDADGIGTLVGLTTFGAETIAWREVISPDSHIHTPEWIADPETTPPFGTQVTVRLRPGERKDRENK